MLLCLHEEHAVAIAHGYAKVDRQADGRDRAQQCRADARDDGDLQRLVRPRAGRSCSAPPGRSTPRKRRPWIDWIHTAQDQGALVRNYTKWDDQPASVAGRGRSRCCAPTGWRRRRRCGPVYVCLDAALQESRIGELPPLPSAARFRAAARRPRPIPTRCAEAAALLQAARAAADPGRPRSSRGEADWQRRIELAEALGAVVLTDPKTGAGFPDRATNCTARRPATTRAPTACALIREADVILSLDWVDLAGALKTACGDAEPVGSKVILGLARPPVHNGWSMDYQGLPPVDLHLAVEPDIAVAALLPLLQAARARLARPPAATAARRCRRSRARRSRR